MPGHKGQSVLGCEPFDLTEIDGADELFAPDGIIAESEENASKIFGCPTVYSTEGSSLCIRTMLFLAMQFAVEHGKQPCIAATRNAHRAFLSSAILLDFQPVWVPHESGSGYLDTTVSPQELEHFLENSVPRPTALYLTSPDYLGTVADIRKISEICHKYDVLLLADNAHGAYLHWMPQQHPSMLGADICCDSAHKTLPVLTGGAYLHMSGKHRDFFASRVKSAMTLFASTSPSYLILASLDHCNKLLAEDYPQKLRNCAEIVANIKDRLLAQGYPLCGNEPLKITISAKSYGYYGTELAADLRQHGIFHEFADKDHLVLMCSPCNSAADLERTCSVLLQIERKQPVFAEFPFPDATDFAMSPRKAAFAPCEQLPIDLCKGRICAETAFSCPPAVPIVFCGERITEKAVACFRYCGIKECLVVSAIHL